MNGYTIGFIIEGALALILIIALIAVCTRKRKAKNLAEESAAEVAATAAPQRGRRLLRFQATRTL